jgi:TM2 domain-containing membrane protein YozV
MRRYDTGLAYLFWLISFSGFAGLHRFYLGKPVSGLLYLLTWGFFGVGTIIDAIRMPDLVRRARLERRIDQLLDYDEGDLPGAGGRTRRVDQVSGGSAGGWSLSRGTPGSIRGSARRGGLEHEILTHALERHGLVTPSRVALEVGTTPEKVRQQLEKLVVQGFANPAVSRDGAMVYVFPEFLDDQGRRELADLTN